MLLSKIKLYFETIKYLKIIQILWRLKYHFFKAPVPKTYNSKLRQWKNKWFSPSWGILTWDGEDRFTFLAQSHEIKIAADWVDSSKDALWIYNLHYHDWINSSDSHGVSKIKELIYRWINENSDSNSIGWDPYCISLRIVNWVKWMSANEIEDKVLIECIERQADNLIHKLEFHIQANHLFANIKALIFVGCFLEGEIANKCLKIGIKLLKHELNEQFLSDGGHYELSPMYHQILMWDLLDLLQLANLTQVNVLEEKVEKLTKLIWKAQEWRKAMIHPNGEFSFFNDCALGVAPPNSVIEDYLKLLAIAKGRGDLELIDLKDTGYQVVNIENEGKLIFDTGNIGPNFQPGHAHADTLSFELSLFGSRWFVNSGTSMYGNTHMRQFQRSTLAHNTVSVDGQNSSQVWGGFRVAKRAKILSSSMTKTADNIKLEGIHDGFVSLNIAGPHSRKITLHKNTISITDKVYSLNGKKAVAYFYLHPFVQIISSSNNSIALKLEHDQIWFNIVNGTIKVVDSKWFPEFGVSFPNKCIEVTFYGEKLLSDISW